MGGGGVTLSDGALGVARGWLVGARQGWAQAPGTQLHSTVSLLSASQETDLFGEMHSGVKRILEKDKSENRPTAHHVPSTVVNALYDSLIGSSPGLRGSNCFHSYFGNEENDS